MAIEADTVATLFSQDINSGFGTGYDNAKLPSN